MPEFVPLPRHRYPVHWLGCRQAHGRKDIDGVTLEDLLARNVTVSLETMKIVDALPLEIRGGQ